MLLLGQFREFLELTGLSPFRGFRDEDFEFFETREPARQVIVRDRLGALGAALSDALDPAERRALGELHVGQIGRDQHAWLCTRYGENVVNLTVELHAHELQVNVVGWNDIQARRFEQWLANGGFVSLTTLDGYRLVVFERSAYNIEKRDQGDRPWWQKETSKDVGERAATKVTPAWVAKRMPLASDRKWQKPGFHLRRAWPREEVVRRRVGIVTDVVADFRAMLPLVDEINGARKEGA